MRKDVMERMIHLKKEGLKPNYTKVGKRYNCDYRTAKKYYEQSGTPSRTKVKKASKLDGYYQTIKEKIEYDAPATSIYHFIKKQGYQGRYTILREYCKTLRKAGHKTATIRFETNPGLQAQVDWKEKMRLTNKHGEVFEIDIFLMVLGYSRFKYIELTINKNQDTLFRALAKGFKYFKGIPKEILFDNMKTVIDHAKTIYQKPIINSKFYEFSKDMGFKVKSCMAYRPQTKGKVESLARLMNRLKVYNNEFETYDELDEIVKRFNLDLNNEISQALKEAPAKRHQKEKEYLNKLPQQGILEHFNTTIIVRKVSKESMITYNKSKYSVSTKYIGKLLTIKQSQGILQVYYNNNLIKEHKVSDKYLNYDKKDMAEILKSDAFKNYSDDDIENYVNDNISFYDEL